MNAVGRLTSHISFFATSMYNYIGSRSLLKDMVTTTVFSVVGKGAGFLVPILVASWFGISGETDAFFFSYGLIIFLTGILSPVVESVIVPFIAEMKSRDESEVKVFLGATLIFVTIVLTLIGGLFGFISVPVLKVATNFSVESINLIAWLLVEMIPLLVLVGISSLLSGVLNAYRIYWLPAISPAIRILTAILGIWVLKDSWGVHSIGFGYVIGEIIRLLFLINEIFRKKLLVFRISINCYSKFIEFLRTSFYQVIGMVVVAINPMVDKAMASWIGPGNVSILEYADRIYQIPVILISHGLFVVLLSYWSDDFYRSGQVLFKKKVTSMAKMVGGGSLVLSLIMIWFRRDVVSLLYSFGNFPAESLSAVSSVLALYLVGLAPTVVGLVFTRAHLVEKNAKTLMILSALNCLLHLILNLSLIKYWGVFGLALSTTIAHSVVAAFLYFTFIYRAGGGSSGSCRKAF